MREAIYILGHLVVWMHLPILVLIGLFTVYVREKLGCYDE